MTGIDHDGSLTVSHQGGQGVVKLPVDYARAHLRLGYVATEHGWESDTVTTGMSLASAATTRRGLYVAVTRGSDENLICVITDSDDVAEAREILDRIVAIDRADKPAVTMPGRDILQRFVGSCVKGANYEAFRNLIVDQMIDDSFVPSEMSAVMEQILTSAS